MKSKHFVPIASAISLLVIASLACAALSKPEPSPTPLPPPTNTPIPVPTERPTLTPAPSRVPQPTPTLEPTPAPLGVPVKNDKFEVTVLKSRILDSGVHTGDGYYWTTKPGYLFVELGVKVSNLDSNSKPSVPWSHIYVVEDNGDSWYPSWGGFKAVGSGVEVDPSGISVSSIENGDDLVVFGDDLYLRLIYIVTEKKPTIVVFGFDDSPMTEIIVNK